MKKTHKPTITYPIAEGINCKGCGSPMKHNEKGIAWCAAAPGFCTEKNKRISYNLKK